jgi:hypothetical protein
VTKADVPKYAIPYLEGRFERGDMVLFTGAGFSRDARNALGKQVPSVDELRALLSELVYPRTPLSDDDGLQDLFGLARVRARTRLRDMLSQQFAVDRDGIPDMYVDLFSAAWHRVYTLNIDDLPDALNASRTLPRSLLSLTPHAPSGRSRDDVLEVVHLNGRWDDGPDGVTFSADQFGGRIPGRDPLHAQCAVDVLSRPVLFIGTSLNEPPLWQAIQLRRSATGKDLRRRSFLVTPDLSRSRRDFLERELHVEHIPMDVREFHEQIFKAAAAGSKVYFTSLTQRTLWERALERPPLVSELVAEESKRPLEGEYLLGRDPTWADITEGRAAEREFESDLRHVVENILSLEGEPRRVVILAGTAGSGKSSAIMRLGLYLTAGGTECAYTSTDLDVAPRDLRSLASLGELPEVLLLDDADRYGAEASMLAKDLRVAEGHPLIVLAVRSGRVDRISDRLTLLGVEHLEVVIPRLTDTDIDALLRVLHHANRLGVLKNLPMTEQRRAFRARERANRDLLVAMLEATSGRRFEARLEEELDQLQGQQRFVYAMVAIATAYRFGLSRDQVLLGVGDSSNETLQAVDNLTRRLLVLEYPGGTLRARHRVVGERVVRYLIRTGSIRDPLLSLTIAIATGLGPRASRDSTAYRALRTLMNHDWLQRALGGQPARGFLAELEPYLSWDHHYWLQRGSLELEIGDQSLAENFLNQAAGIEPTDLLVQTELGYLKLKIAVAEKDLVHSQELLEEGLNALELVMARRNHFDPHQYDIYGRMVLKWSERDDVPAADRESYLRNASEVVERGRKKHPGDERLRDLFVKVTNRRLEHA